jgi:hypothetical protein
MRMYLSELLHGTHTYVQRKKRLNREQINNEKRSVNSKLFNWAVSYAVVI